MKLRDVKPGNLVRQIGQIGLDDKPDNTLFLVLCNGKYVNTKSWCLTLPGFDHGQDVEDIGLIQEYCRKEA